MAVAGTEAVILDTLMRYLAGRTFAPAMQVAQARRRLLAAAQHPLSAGRLPANTSRLDGLAFDSDRTHVGLFVVHRGLARRARLREADGSRRPGPARLHGRHPGRRRRPDRRDRRRAADRRVVDDPPWIGVPVTIRWRVGTTADA